MKNVIMLLGAAIILVLSDAKNLIVDGDTFWAIKVGEWISQNRELPKVDMFSWTANGNPWVAHEWLFDLLIYKFHNVMGYYGIVFFMTIGVFITLYFLWKLYLEENKNMFLTLIMFTIVIFMLRGGIVARPHVYGYLFFVYFLYVIYRKNNLLWTLPPITLIWANMHGSVILGTAMIFLQLAYEFIYSTFAEKRVNVNKSMLYVSFLVPLASLINPYGIELWKASIMQITNDMNRLIIEWQPPDFKDPGWLILYMVVIIMTVVVSFSKSGITDKRKFYLLTIYLLGTFYAAITGIRYYPYLAICWGLYVLALIPGDLFSDKSWNKKFLIIYSCLIVIIILQLERVPATIEEVVDKGKWPMQALEHLENKKTFNDYKWGGMLIYKNIPVFIDGRADVYWKNSNVFEDYLDVCKLKKDPIDIFNKYNVEQVIVPINSPIDIYLKRAGGIEKYRDETAVIYDLI